MKLRLGAAQYAALQALDEALGHTGYALIGAAALGYHIELPRYTADLDLIVACEANDLDARLIGRGWQRDARLAYRWQLQRVNVDIVVASTHDLAVGYVDYDGYRLNLVGCDLALRHAQVAQLRPQPDEGTATCLIATLPSIVVMKMAAWLDRPSARTKDLGDLARALTDVDCEDRRWDLPPSATDLEYDDVPPFLVGCDVGEIAERAHVELIRKFVQTVPVDTMGTQAAWPQRDRESRAVRTLTMFERGVAHGKHKPQT
jgi:predicted nucleotidyltransferase